MGLYTIMTTDISAANRIHQRGKKEEPDSP
jgi:hypothetical protein